MLAWQCGANAPYQPDPLLAALEILSAAWGLTMQRRTPPHITPVHTLGWIHWHLTHFCLQGHTNPHSEHVTNCG